MSKAKSQDEATQEKMQASAGDAAGKQQQQAPQVQVDDSRAVTSYANFCRVTGTPEEMIIDLGLNKQPTGASVEPIRIDQRLIVNYYTAKRMLAALNMAVLRHEAAFGVLETNVQKRVVSKG